MLESYTRQIDTIDTTTIKRIRKKTVKRTKKNRIAAFGRPAMKVLGSLISLRSTNPRPALVKQRETIMGQFVTFNAISVRCLKKQILKNNWVNNP